MTDKAIEIEMGMLLLISVNPDIQHMSSASKYMLEKIIKRYETILWCEDMSQAPRDEKILVWSGDTYFCAQWVKNSVNDHEAWLIATYTDEGDQILCINPTAWRHLPEYRKGE